MPFQARQYLEGQIGHKRLYYKYIADRFILNVRYSIWRDFIWDFWKKLYNDFKYGVYYTYTNPLMNVLFGFPFLPILILYYLIYPNAFINANIQSYIINVPIFASLFLFFMTSFRKTRFLGEPQRYVEFSKGFIAISSAVYMNKNIYLILIVLSFSFLLILFELFFFKIWFQKPRLSRILADTEKIKKIIFKDNSQEIRILSNNMDLSKFFLNENCKIFRGGWYSEWIGNYHFTSVFKDNFNYINPEIIIELIKEYSINWFILDTNIITEQNIFLKNDGLKFFDMGKAGKLKLFKVC
ncbi:MAG: hypothetical protein J7K53_05600 [Bacteroidales bacterium]|nr:hypothetical protein [Bacteroidales bacterium]